METNNCSMENPKISIIVPVYNVEEYIRKCAESLVHQSLDEIEIIFVDDKSPDHSVDILTEYQNNYPGKVKLLRLDKNVRQGGARNAGIRIAKGQYIGFVDSDDYVSPDMYRILFDRAVETNAQIVFCKGGIVYNDNPDYDRLTPVHYWNKKIRKMELKELSDDDRCDLICNPIGSVWSGIYKKSLIIENNLFFPERVIYEDNYWCSLIRMYAYRVSFVDSILYYYRQNLSSVTHKKNQASSFDRVLIENMLLEETKRRSLLYKYRTAIEYNYAIRGCVNTVFVIAKLFDKPDVKRLRIIKKQTAEFFPRWIRNHYIWEAKRSIKIKALLVRYIDMGLLVNIYGLISHISENK